MDCSEKGIFVKNIFQNCNVKKSFVDLILMVSALMTQFSLKSMQLHEEVLSQCWISEKDLKYIHRIIMWLPSFVINVGGYSEIC